ncbi:MAG: DNA polymerase I, partial [Rhodospirillales bacterium]|nr:DNA polymerase I [Rhodospirillales bacterium]
IEPGRACYIPLAHKVAAAQGAFDLGDGGGDAGGNGDEIKQIPRAEALSLLKGLLEDPAVLKIGQNIKYDMLVLARYDLRIDPIDDTMLLSYVLDAGAHGHGMDELADLHLGVETVKFKDVVGTGRKAVTFDYVPLEAARDYAAEDADITLRLHGLLKSRLLAERMVTVYETLERPLVPVLVDMERRGIRVDAARLRELSDDFAVRLADLETEIHKLAGREFNVGSPKQLGEVLFEDMSLPGGKKSGKSDAYATGAEILEELAAQGHDMPARVLDWRQLAKLKSTYTDALLGQINPDTGRVHTSYSMAATTTGRLASSDPNLQNIPIRTEEGRKIRCAFVPKDGHVLLSADYSQIELRLLAHVAGIDVLKDAFRNDVDIHALTASQVFGVPIEGMDPMVRRKAKAINFGIVYGISAFGLANQLGIGRGEAAAYIEAYFEKYPGIRAYMDETKEQARKQGFVSTLYGRKVHLRGIADRNPSVRNFAERAAINAPIQGGAADIIKRAMIRLPGELKAAGLDAGMLLQVHDELVFEVPAAQVDATRDVVRRVMEGAAALSVPLTVDVGAGKNWGEAH